MTQCKLPDTDSSTRKQLEQALDEAEEKAHKSLARYKFMLFGYWAAIWTHLNRVGNFHRPNPFSDYVEIARKKGGALGKRKPNQQTQNVSPTKER